MRNADLAKEFAQGATSGKGSNMYIEGKSIMSYGHHFPIAVRIDGMMCLWNKDGYSVTTEKHKSYVAHALKKVGYRLIEASTKQCKDAVEGISVVAFAQPIDDGEMLEILERFVAGKGIRYKYVVSQRIIKYINAVVEQKQVIKRVMEEQNVSGDAWNNSDQVAEQARMYFERKKFLGAI